MTDCLNISKEKTATLQKQHQNNLLLSIFFLFACHILKAISIVNYVKNILLTEFVELNCIYYKIIKLFIILNLIEFFFG